MLRKGSNRVAENAKSRSHVESRLPHPMVRRHGGSTQEDRGCEIHPLPAVDETLAQLTRSGHFQ